MFVLNRSFLFIRLFFSGFCLVNILIPNYIQGQNPTQSQFSLDTLSQPPYVTRMKNGECSYKKFFAIGTNLHSWAQSGTYDNLGRIRFSSEAEFSSAKEIFTVLFNVYPNEWPNYYSLDPASNDCIFMSGFAFIHWKLRMDPRINTRSKIPTDGKYIRPMDQKNISKNKNIESISSQIMTTIIENTYNRGDFIYYLADEPERGQGGSWIFYNDLMKKFYDNKGDYLSYIDLGPINGNFLVYDLYNSQNPTGYPIPSDDIAKYDSHDYQYSSLGYEKNVKMAAHHYQNVCDIIGINSYQHTSTNPELLGNIIDWLFEVNKNKPVWPWISGEVSKYNTTNRHIFRNFMRRQAYTAIVHGASGIMIYSEGRDKISHSDWDISLDLAKELQLYRSILENGTAYEWNYDYSIHWRTINWGDSYFIFAVNNTDVGDTISNSMFPDLILDSSECGLWISEDANTIKKLTSPQNLGFEKEILSSWDSDSKKFLNWKKSISGTSNIFINTDEKKIGNQSLSLKSTSEPDSRAAVEQCLEGFQGAKYKLQAWYKHRSGNAQHLIIQFYGQKGWISEKKSISYTDDKWRLVTAEGISPPGTEQVKIHINSGYPGQKSEGYWDDVMIQLIDIE